MRPCLRILFATLLSGMASCATAQNLPAADGNAAVADPGLQPSVLDSADQNSPETLNGRLAYAQQLVEAAEGDCRQPADAAQAQLNIVAAKPAFVVAMPLGPARAASIDYRIHAARAACSAEATVQQSEFRAARDAALRAADLYRDGFDYQSMAVMQFDAAVADRELGDQASAVAMLKSAIETDRTYGFQKDGQDNAALLQQWTDDGSGPGGEAAPTVVVPSRSAALKFAWSARDAEVTVSAAYADVVNQQIVRSQGAAARAVSIRPATPGWVVSFPSNDRTFNFDGWPKGPAASHELMNLLMANIQLASPGVRVGGAGDFEAVVDPDKVSAKLWDETKRLTLYVVPESKGDVNAMPNVGRAVSYFSAPYSIEAMAAEDYALATGTWIDAKLDQGVWYDLTASLRAPGTASVVDHDIQFAYTGPAPCTAASTRSDCVEIIVHATPNPVALGKWTAYIRSAAGLRAGRTVHYVSGADMRIVTDPDSLQPYVLDVRRYWYALIDGVDKDGPEIHSERIVSTWTWR